MLHLALACLLCLAVEGKLVNKCFDRLAIGFQSSGIGEPLTLNYKKNIPKQV